MTRADIEAAVEKTPPHIREQLTGTGKGSLELLDTYLPDVELVEWIASAAPGYRATEFHCLFAVTNRRLLFIAPSPQVLSWRLSTITRVQALDGPAGSNKTFFVDDSGGGAYQLGADGAWGQQFVPLVKVAIARAILQDR